MAMCGINICEGLDVNIVLPLKYYFNTAFPLSHMQINSMLDK